MNIEIITGIVVVAVSLSLVISLAVWARKSINRIAESGYRTARETLKDLKRGQ